MRYILAFVALATIAACDTTGQGYNAGVGFGNFGQYKTEKARREAELAGKALPAPYAVSDETLPPSQIARQPSGTAQVQATPEADLATDTQTALNGSTQAVEPGTLNNPGISDENDFEAVGARRTIETDAELLARNKEKYKVLEAQPLPRRTGSNGPNIVEYALRSKQPVGTQVYSRIGLKSANRYRRNCGKYPSPDMAQSAFLAKGGPERDRLGLDPDGDGYACSWDPTPFRKAVGG
jgi:hypothetical protein